MPTKWPTDPPKRVSTAGQRYEIVFLVLFSCLSQASAPVIVVNIGFESYPSQRFGVSLHELRETFKRMIREVASDEESKFLAEQELLAERQKSQEIMFGEVVNAILDSSTATAQNPALVRERRNERQKKKKKGNSGDNDCEDDIYVFK